jgi:hypothetical protein
MDLKQAMEWVGIATVVGRAVLEICDALDERIPALKALTNALGTVLGGKKPRYAE